MPQLPKYTNMIGTNLDDQSFSILCEAASDLSISKSAMVRLIILDWIKRQKRKVKRETRKA